VPSWALNNITAPDSYTNTSTLQNLPVLDHINIDVYNAAIYWQPKEVLGATNIGITAPDTLGTWGTEVYMTPGSRSIIRPGLVGIRVRAAVLAANLPYGTSQAQTTIECVL